MGPIPVSLFRNRTESLHDNMNFHRITCSVVTVQLALSILLMAGGCATGPKLEAREKSQAIWMGLVMEPTGEVAGSPYHVLDDSALRSSFERWRDDSVQHGLSIEVKDAGETSMKTVMHAIERVEALMPPEVRERVTIRVKSPNADPNMNFDVTH
jgi:hypothetical protein